MVGCAGGDAVVPCRTNREHHNRTGTHHNSFPLPSLLRPFDPSPLRTSPPFPSFLRSALPSSRPFSIHPSLNPPSLFPSIHLSPHRSSTISLPINPSLASPFIHCLSSHQSISRLTVHPPSRFPPMLSSAFRPAIALRHALRTPHAAQWSAHAARQSAHGTVVCV